MQQGPRGWFPHDLVRDALRNELDCEPDRKLELLDRIAPYFLDSGAASRLSDPSIVAEHFYFYRNLMPPIFNPNPEPVHADLAQDDDLPHLREMVERLEGSAELRVFDFWWARQPVGVRVIRDGERKLRGFYQLLRFTEPLADEELAEDPVSAHFWAQRHELARSVEPGEGGHLV